VALVVISLALLVLLLSGTRRKDPHKPLAASSRGEAVASAGEARRYVEATIPDAGPEPDAEPDPETAPPGHIVYRRATWDDWREQEGLPIVSPALTAIEEFRPASPAERADPEAQALYQLDRDIYRFQLLSVHEEQESERFVRDAQQAESSVWRERLVQASKDHAKLAQEYKEHVPVLAERRRALVHEVFQKRGSAR
jgi:hypothetical protein